MQSPRQGADETVALPVGGVERAESSGSALEAEAETRAEAYRKASAEGRLQEYYLWQEERTRRQMEAGGLEAWRERQRRAHGAGRAATRGGAVAPVPDVRELISATVLPHMRENRMIDLKTEWRMHRVCAAFRLAREHARSAYDQYMARLRSGTLRHATWLPTGRESLTGISHGHLLYYADMLIRCFLRHVLRERDQVVLAGSAGTAILLNKIGTPRSWSPNDVDFFVTDEKYLEQIGRAYVAGVLNPLGVDSEARVRDWYDDSDDEDSDAFDATGVPDYIRHDGVLADGYDELRGIVRGPSNGGGPASYDALRVAVIVPRLPDGFPNDLRALIRPINVIHVRVPGAAPGSPVDLPARVRGGFDLVPSAVSVGVDDDLEFRCTCNLRTFAAVHQAVLFFNPEAVSRRKYKDIPRMLFRVRKYTSRGFVFVPSSTMIIASLSAEERHASVAVVDF